MVGLPSSGPVGLEGAQWEAETGSSATYLFFYYSTIQLSTNLLFYYSTVHQSTFLLFNCAPIIFLLPHPRSTLPSQVYASLLYHPSCRWVVQ